MMQGRRLLLLLVLLATSVRFSRAQAAAKQINCGGQAYRDSEGNNWMPDLYYQGGMTYENTDEGISGSVDDILYQTE
jgi:Tfp pilus assembly protein FimT